MLGDIKMDRLTVDDVYDIAAEVCEEMITKFLANLVKLVPNVDTVVEDIQEQQYQELRQLRQQKLQTQTKSVDYAPDGLDNVGDNNDFAAIARNRPIGDNVQEWESKNNFDNVLGVVDLPTENLAGLASDPNRGE